MAFTKKTPLEKFETKIKNLVVDVRFVKTSRTVKFENEKLFTYSKNSIQYGYKRCYVSKVEPITSDDFKVTIVLNDENLSLISSNIANPPLLSRTVIDLFRKSTGKDFDTIVIGNSENKIANKVIYVTKELYNIISDINKEEGRDRNVRFLNRTIPFLKTHYGVEPKARQVERDYSLLLQELIASGMVNQEDIIALTQKLNAGNNADVIIKQQVHKQVEWLVDTIQIIIDEPKLNRAKAKELGNKYFSFLKTEINGPEHLMEKILTKYGQYTIFGSPVLLNTDKYVVNNFGLPRSQFDILLINHLSDLEVVELKRPDIPILEYDEGRNKFFASRELSVAISQAERYISAVFRDNDEGYKIDNLKIRDYLNREIGGTMTVEIARPSALIVIGSYQSIASDYSSLSDKNKRKVSKEDYEKNYLMAYKELKGAYKNINITSYSELIESARTRMIINKEENKDELETASGQE
jgi:hypothetical protein